MFSAKRVSLLAVASLLLVGAGCGLSGTSGTPTGPGSAAVGSNPAPGAGAGTGTEPVTPPATGRTKTVTLRAVTGSGEYGSATFTDVGDNETKVTIRLAGAPKNTVQPATIVLGDCATSAGGVKWPLPNIIDGAASTTLGAKFDELFTAGSINYSLRVKKDAVQTAGETYAACGDLK
ncbi:MAG TPA: hypothetical protein VL500_05215 [Candidatus Eisenbacteria bacterium]|jgi:hypothetical protein|nr:hypothetical protein [Candidatus Eisenbacteria bacterium]